MRRLARFSRPLSALFALWFAIVLGDPGVLHACPMHGGHGSAHSPAAATAPSHGGHGAHLPSATSDLATDTGQHGDTSAPCTCVGQCCAAPAAAPVRAAAAMIVPEAVAEARHQLAAPAADAPASPDRRFPFPNGPPTA